MLFEANEKSLFLFKLTQWIHKYVIIETKVSSRVEYVRVTTKYDQVIPDNTGRMEHSRGWWFCSNNPVGENHASVIGKSIPSRQNCRKSNVEECIFHYMASHIECRFNKNSFLQCYFLAILPAGYTPVLSTFWK